MSADNITTRRAEAVRLLEVAGWPRLARDIDSLSGVDNAIGMIVDTQSDGDIIPGAPDRAALHALALLLAAMTEPA